MKDLLLFLHGQKDNSKKIYPVIFAESKITKHDQNCSEKPEKVSGEENYSDLITTFSHDKRFNPYISL